MTTIEQSPIPMKLVPAWLLVGFRELGQREVAGHEANPRIAEYLATTTLPAALAQSDETPWCSAFANWCMGKAGLTGTNSAAARSWLEWGTRMTVPTIGAVAVLDGGSRPPPAGHVGFYIHHTAKEIFVFGGNQGNEPCVAAYPLKRLLGYRWPAPLHHLIP